MSNWNLHPSTRSVNSKNPIKEAIADVPLPENFHLPTYSLALGDPTAFPEFSVHPLVIKLVEENLLSGSGNGYTHALGPKEAREALAAKYSYENIQLTWEDVFLDVGGCGAIHTAMSVFLNPGDNILIPAPGFPLYMTVAWNLNAEARCYRLKPDQGWEVDFESLERIVDERTKLLVIVNPSNPCGSVWTREHLLEILEWCRAHKVCVLADEVYHGMTYGKPHYPMGSLTDEVPVITIGALSKIFLVPGWRCGWIIVYDKYKKCTDIKEGIFKIKNLLLHGVPFIANAIPRLFAEMPENYMSELMQKVKDRAEFVYEKVQEIPGLAMQMPEGSLYCMISIETEKFEDIRNSVDFTEKLAREQGILVLPAEALMSEKSFRIVLCSQLSILEDAMGRIKEFVSFHLKSN
ncbi:unnamed protein product [Blepharisma stoltei]|uniref:Aminotransferase class I/classII large domain-containing protein n=1 Tax=Blepharisma stoltei TaxID=1481888 RepID=A0AAU9J6A1_9CILI|nr:unnamed protein product [Blepharisma stoltei]